MPNSNGMPPAIFVWCGPSEPPESNSWLEVKGYALPGSRHHRAGRIQGSGQVVLQSDYRIDL